MLLFKVFIEIYKCKMIILIHCFLLFIGEKMNHIVFKKVTEMLKRDIPIVEIARETKISMQSIRRLRNIIDEVNEKPKEIK
jgi:hypothetical protein